MNYETPLISAKLVRRYKRFLADMRLPDGGMVVAHCPNPGAMTGLAEPGARCWLSTKEGKSRKLDFGWELVRSAGGALVGINTSHANRIVAEVLGSGVLPGLPRGGAWRSEVTFTAGTRFDFAHADAGGRLTYVEVKSVTLSRQTGLAEFPDAKTARGVRHLCKLAAAVALGHGAMMLFLVQRDDCDHLTVAADIDPKYGASLEAARRAGVAIAAIGCNVSTSGIYIGKSVEFDV